MKFQRKQRENKQVQTLPASSKFSGSKLKLDKVVFFLTILWVVTSLLLILYGPSSAHAVQPHKPRPQQVAGELSQAAARASFIY
jgi:preprotein translocase subunit SecG